MIILNGPEDTERALRHGADPQKLADVKEITGDIIRRIETGEPVVAYLAHPYEGGNMNEKTFEDHKKKQLPALHPDNEGHLRQMEKRGHYPPPRQF